MRGSTTGAAHREEPGEGGSRLSGAQLNHADPARLVEQLSGRGRPRGFESLDPYEVPLNLRGAPGGNGAHCHKARAGRHGQLNSGTLAVRCGARRRPVRHRHAPRTNPGISRRRPRKPARAGTTTTTVGTTSRSDARRPQGGAAVRKTVASAAGFDPLARNDAAWRISPGDRVKGGSDDSPPPPLGGIPCNPQSASRSRNGAEAVRAGPAQRQSLSAPRWYAAAKAQCCEDGRR